MYIKQTILLLGLIFITLDGISQSNQTLTLDDVHFSSIFGVNHKDPSNTYCLLGLGFFLTPRSENSDSLIKNWITKHPKATVIPVSTMGPTTIDDKNSKQTYCWLVDGNDTINNYLIRNGCFPGPTMRRPQTWDEMSEKEKSFYEGEDDDKPTVKVLIDEKSYTNFIEQIKEAEKYASENKLGIWLDPEKYGY